MTRIKLASSVKSVKSVVKNPRSFLRDLPEWNQRLLQNPFADAAFEIEAVFFCLVLFSRGLRVDEWKLV
jgi:hypothetical protein